MNPPDDAQIDPEFQSVTQQTGPTMSQSESAGKQGNKVLAALAWAVILTVAALIVWSVSHVPQSQAESAEATAQPPFQLVIVGRFAVGASEMFSEYDELLLGQMQLSANDPLLYQLCRVVLSGELQGPDRAMEELSSLDERIDEADLSPDESELSLKSVLERLYADRVSNNPHLPSLSDLDRDAISNRLGWFGDLALLASDTPDQTARAELIRPLAKVPFVLFGTAVWYLLFGAAGFVGIITLLILAVTGKLTHGFGHLTGRGLIYAETFAIWLVVFIGSPHLVEMVFGPDKVLTAALLIFPLSLGALAWPVLRGIPWSQVRRDIGWTTGRGFIAEPAAGIVCYAIAIPLLGAGLIVALVLMYIQEQISPGEGAPSHPIPELLADGDFWTTLQIFLLGCVAAPVVEETMFRGVLYRHLREATGSFGFVISMIASMLGVSLLFGVIHPQGWAFAPVLMGLAAGYSIAREWRGSLLSCMTAHALTNGVTLSINYALFA